MAETDADKELLQDEFEALAVEHEKAQTELKKLKKLESLRTARPVQIEADVHASGGVGQAGNISLSNAHLGLIVSLLVIIGFLWQNIGSPITGMRDDVRDMKANYVRKDDLKGLAQKSDVDAIKTQTDRHETKFAQYDQLKEQRDAQIKILQDGQSKADSNQNAFEQRLTRLEALKGGG